jgi:hypothetical protein
MHGQGAKQALAKSIKSTGDLDVIGLPPINSLVNELVPGVQAVKVIQGSMLTFKRYDSRWLIKLIKALRLKWIKELARLTLLLDAFFHA